MNIKIKTAWLFLVLLLPFSAFADEPEESPFYGQVALHDYHGDGAFYAQEAYFQGQNDNGVAVWVTGYRDDEFWSASTGLSKTYDSGWTIALGVGKAHFDGESHSVIAPWVSYESDEWEFLASAEYYKNGGDPFYRGYLQRRFGHGHFIGMYGESGLGLGPALTFGISERVAFRVVVPVADRQDTQVLATVFVTF